MAVTPGRGGSTRWLLVILLAAVAFGGAAALLAGPAAPFSPAAPSGGGPLPFAVVGQLLGVSIVALCVLWIVYHVYQRFTSGTLTLPTRAVVVFLVAFLLAVGFIVLARSGVLGTAPLLQTQPAGAGNGSTTPPTNVNLNNSSNPTLGLFHVGAWSVPGWALYVGLILAALGAAIVVPRVISALRAPGEVPSASDRTAESRRDFAEALKALDDPSNPDVRAVIIALYARLLARVRPSVARLETLAPREIAAECVDRLRIREETARELTGLFEEARYSSHPLSPGLADRARRAVAQALEDLDQRPGRR